MTQTESETKKDLPLNETKTKVDIAEVNDNASKLKVKSKAIIDMQNG